MSRWTICSLISALKTKGRLTSAQLARETLTNVTSIREWMYDLERAKLVRRHLETQKGKSSGRSTIYWEWIQ